MKNSSKSKLALLCAALLLIFALTGCMAADGTTDSAGTATGMGSTFMIVYVVAIVAVMYFVMVKPERKRRKQAEELRNSIAVGDTITTIGGLVGKVVDMKDDFVTFETSEDRVRIEIAKWGISSVGKKAENDQA